MHIRRLQMVQSSVNYQTIARQRLEKWYNTSDMHYCKSVIVNNYKYQQIYSKIIVFWGKP